MRGEELLGSWKPRGVSLIDDYYHYKHLDGLLQDVMTTRAILANIPPIRLLPANAGENDDWKVVHALTLWQKRFGRSEEVGILFGRRRIIRS